MTIQMYVQLYLMLAGVILLAWIASLWDVKRMRSQAERQREQQRIIDVLKRSE